tara:strand:+ start:390 stop:1301 length:912 start_codon:yes stop_codon:yes gene_type:complete
MIKNNSTLFSIIIGIILLFSLTQINWNPSGQLRKVEPWRDWDVPTDPDEIQAYQFAHSIKLPDELELDTFFKEGWFGVFGRTTSDEYFEHLCETEAGEFIYKTVDNVEGIYQMRPRKRASTQEFTDRYMMEDPYGYTDGEANEPEYIYVNPEKYEFIEMPIRERELPGWKWKKRHNSYLQPIPENMKYRKFSGYDGRNKLSMIMEYTNERVSTYGYTWRGIHRPYDRENGVSGGELIILDLDTNEVLAVRRGFARTGGAKNTTGINWEFTQVCPTLSYRKGWSKDFDLNYWLVSKVLKPIDRN